MEGMFLERAKRARKGFKGGGQLRGKLAGIIFGVPQHASFIQPRS